MEDYIDKGWRDILAHNGLADFEAFWTLTDDWFEPPNKRRGGWSGVSRCELDLPNGGKTGIFLKRQENHCARSLRHPLYGISTFLREYEHIMRYRALSVPTLEVVYFAQRGQGQQQRAILVTAELTGFISLADQEQQWLRNGLPSRTEKRRIIEATASLLHSLHKHRIRHGCFFPKHVFIKVNPGGAVEARVIDLEKAHWHISRERCAARDLYSLAHYALPGIWTLTDRLYFLKSYLGLSRLNSQARRLWRNVVARSVQRRGPQ